MGLLSFAQERLFIFREPSPKPPKRQRVSATPAPSPGPDVTFTSRSWFNTHSSHDFDFPISSSINHSSNASSNASTKETSTTSTPPDDLSGSTAAIDWATNPRPPTPPRHTDHTALPTLKRPILPIATITPAAPVSPILSPVVATADCPITNWRIYTPRSFTARKKWLSAESSHYACALALLEEQNRGRSMRRRGNVEVGKKTGRMVRDDFIAGMEEWERRIGWRGGVVCEVGIGRTEVVVEIMDYRDVEEMDEEDIEGLFVDFDGLHAAAEVEYGAEFVAEDDVDFVAEDDVDFDAVYDAYFDAEDGADFDSEVESIVWVEAGRNE